MVVEKMRVIKAEKKEKLQMLNQNLENEDIMNLRKKSIENNGMIKYIL
jgi:hypothetical protein